MTRTVREMEGPFEKTALKHLSIAPVHSFTPFLNGLTRGQQQQQRLVFEWIPAIQATLEGRDGGAKTSPRGKQQAAITLQTQRHCSLQHTESDRKRHQFVTVK